MSNSFVCGRIKSRLRGESSSDAVGADGRRFVEAPDQTGTILNDSSRVERGKTMAFYYRVFTTLDKSIWANEIDAFLNESKLGFDALGVVDEEDENNLEAVPIQIVLTDDQGREVAVLEYDRREDSDLLKEEIEEFNSLIDEMAPECNRAWVRDKLASVVGCYAFQILEPGFEGENWDRIATLASWIREETDGIEQSDGGQITNEQGAVVLATPDDEDDEDYEDDEEFEEIDELDEAEDEEDAEDEEEFDDEDDEDDVFTAALRVGDEWVEYEITSDEDLEKFLRGES